MSAIFHGRDKPITEKVNPKLIIAGLLFFYAMFVNWAKLRGSSSWSD
jgi:hypothetical protein